MNDQIIVTQGDDIEVIVEAQLDYNVEIVVTTGQDGKDGDSAYQIWLDLGNTGTEQDFIDSLQDKNWEDDTLTTIKPVDNKTVDGAYISGELFGGLFQP